LRHEISLGRREEWLGPFFLFNSLIAYNLTVIAGNEWLGFVFLAGTHWHLPYDLDGCQG
jgi:hypothetical protein